MSDPISPSVSGAEWWRQDKTELVAALRERESGMRRLRAETYEILAEMQSRCPQAEFGYGSLDALQADVLNISRR
ncbi:MAG: hypothetical protein GEU86_09525, partial [Actinophytocola sp.]|nr:hypothetical protein [Actinophytocola sp.]